MDKPIVQDCHCKTLDKYLQTQKPNPKKKINKPKSINIHKLCSLTKIPN